MDGLSEAGRRALDAIKAWDSRGHRHWREQEPLRAALAGIDPDDAVVLLEHVVPSVGSADDHLLADEIVAAVLPERVRQAYWKLSDGVHGCWWYS